MFKVVALLAIVGYASAGVSLRDAVALQSQIDTQNAINLGGAVRNGLLAGHVAHGLPLAYSAGHVAHGLPLAYSGLHHAVVYNPITANDAISLNSQIATQHAINVNGAVTGAVAQRNQIATQDFINANGAVRNAVLTGVAQGAVPVAYSGLPHLGYAGVSVRDAVALNSQIATQNAINSGLILG